jgi:hypothetical protein
MTTASFDRREARFGLNTNGKRRIQHTGLPKLQFFRDLIDILTGVVQIELKISLWNAEAGARLIGIVQT